MGKVIKMIDLLNMIAKGERPPEKIIIAGHRYKYNKETKDYDSDIGMANENLFLNMGIFKELNIEIIILDEEDEIDIQGIEELPDYNFSVEGNKDKINELIKVIKQLDNKLKEN